MQHVHDDDYNDEVVQPTPATPPPDAVTSAILSPPRSPDPPSAAQPTSMAPSTARPPLEPLVQRLALLSVLESSSSSSPHDYQNDHNDNDDYQDAPCDCSACKDLEAFILRLCDDELATDDDFYNNDTRKRALELIARAERAFTHSELQRHL